TSSGEAGPYVVARSDRIPVSGAGRDTDPLGPQNAARSRPRPGQPAPADSNNRVCSDHGRVRHFFVSPRAQNFSIVSDPLGKPGEFPYTRGIYPDMYRGRLWTIRQ